MTVYCNQFAVEHLGTTGPEASVNQISVQVLGNTQPPVLNDIVQSTQGYIEVLGLPAENNAVSATQGFVEVLYQNREIIARATQNYLEIIGVAQEIKPEITRKVSGAQCTLEVLSRGGDEITFNITVI